MLTRDTTLVELLRGAWPNEWRISDAELLYTRLAASPNLRTAIEYDHGLRAEAEAVLGRAKRAFPGPPAGRRTRRRRWLAGTLAVGLSFFSGWLWLTYQRYASTLAARGPERSVNEMSAAEELSAAVSKAPPVLDNTASTAARARKATVARPVEPGRKQSPAPTPTAQRESEPEVIAAPAAVPAAERKTPPPDAAADQLDAPLEKADEPLDVNALKQQAQQGRRDKRARDRANWVDQPRREHPLEFDPSREAESLSLEIASALAEQQWIDLHRTLESASAETVGSMVPDLEDESLWVSFGTLVESLLKSQAGLRSMVQSELEPLARLRLAAALEAQSEQQVAAVAWHFFGTDAAAQAHLWLADRALSIGSFAAARAHYERAAVYASSTTRGEIASHQRLTGAMLGTPLGKPVTSTVQLANNRLSPIDFEAMVLTQQLTHQRRYVSPVMVGAQASLPHTPAANSKQQPFQLTNWLEYDDLASTRRAGAIPAPEDGPAAELFSLPVGELTILGNALSVSAIETRTAKVRWQKDLTSPRERHGMRAVGPVLPAVADGRIYVRRWMREGTELLCLNLASGDVLWQTELTPDEKNRTLRGIMLTDPQIDGQRLTMLTATPASTVSLRGRMDTEDILWEVRLSEFSRQNGTLLNEKLLAQLTGLTNVPRASRVAQAGRWRIVQLAGTVMCLDATGELAWIRRLPWQETEQFDAHYRCAAVSDNNVVCVWQPGGTTVECLELSTGHRHWEAAASQITRLAGIQDGQLIAVTSEGLEAMNLTDGQGTWSRKLSWAARQAVLCGAPGGLMFAEAQQTPIGSWEGRLFWLDATTGEIRASTSLLGELPETRQAIQPLIGPLTPHGKGLLAGYDAGMRRGQRRELLWITPPQ